MSRETVKVVKFFHLISLIRSGLFGIGGFILGIYVPRYWGVIRMSLPDSLVPYAVGFGLILIALGIAGTIFHNIQETKKQKRFISSTISKTMNDAWDTKIKTELTEIMKNQLLLFKQEIMDKLKVGETNGKPDTKSK